jgi:hypothetical protein
MGSAVYDYQNRALAPLADSQISESAESYDCHALGLAESLRRHDPALPRYIPEANSEGVTILLLQTK